MARRPLRRGRHRLRRSLPTKLAIVLAAMIAVIATADGIALAYFKSSGSGGGHGTVGTLGAITVTATLGGDSAGTTLIPGQSGDVILRVSNPNSYTVHVTSIAGRGTVTASNNCTPTGVTFTPPTDYTGAQFTLATGSNLLRLAGAASMDLTSASACQGATFTIPLSVTVQK